MVSMKLPLPLCNLFDPHVIITHMFRVDSFLAWKVFSSNLSFQELA